MAGSTTWENTGVMVLEAARRLRSYGLRQAEIATLASIGRANEMLGQPTYPFMRAVMDEHYFLEGGRLEDFDYPTDDSTEIVRCVHEGVCPTCGRRAYIVHDERVRVDSSDGYVDLPKWDHRRMTTVECVDGHQATAEPTMSDWVGY